MGSIRVVPNKGTLFMDFRYAGNRMREYTVLPDTLTNRKRLKKALDRIEAEIELGTFDYQRTFGKPFANSGSANDAAVTNQHATVPNNIASTPTMREFANQWFAESEVTWRRSYRITQRGAIDKYILPTFGDKRVDEVSKADLLAFRAELTKLTGRGKNANLSARRINAVMKPLRQIINEAADRYNFNSAFRNIKPLRIKRSDVLPFNLDEVHLLLQSVREDFRNYIKVRFFTGMRTGEVNGLKWKYVDFERRLILVRESIVLGEEDELKTDGSNRDIQMSQIVFDALTAQRAQNKHRSEYVFTNQAGNPIDNKNFINRVWSPLLRHLGLQHRKAYQMRHTAATLWLAAGEAPEWIARQLGHNSTEMLFRVYSRYVPNLTRNDGSAMDRLLMHTFVATDVASFAAAAPAPPDRARPIGRSTLASNDSRQINPVASRQPLVVDVEQTAQPPPMAQVSQLRAWMQRNPPKLPT